MRQFRLWAYLVALCISVYWFGENGGIPAAIASITFMIGLVTEIFLFRGEHIEKSNSNIGVSSNSEPSSTFIQKNETTPISLSSSQSPVLESITTFHNYFSEVSENQSLAEQEAIKQKYIGQTVKWKGTVYLLNSSEFISVRDPEHFSVPFDLNMPKKDEARVLALRIGDLLSFSGVIKKIRGLSAEVNVDDFSVEKAKT